MRTAGEYLGKGGSGYDNGGDVLCGGDASSDPVWVRYVGSDTPVGESPRGVSPQGGTENGGHDPQTSTIWDMGVPTHWGGTGNGGTGGDWGIYRLPPEHSRTINCESSYHGLVSGGGAEAGNAPTQEMVGADRPGYTGDKGRECRTGGGKGDGERRIVERERGRLG